MLRVCMCVCVRACVTDFIVNHFNILIHEQNILKTSKQIPGNCVCTDDISEILTQYNLAKQYYHNV